jgi:hypothetical protein
LQYFTGEEGPARKSRRPPAEQIRTVATRRRSSPANCLAKKSGAPLFATPTTTNKRFREYNAMGPKQQQNRSSSSTIHGGHNVHAVRETQTFQNNHIAITSGPCSHNAGCALNPRIQVLTITFDLYAHIDVLESAI